jgi:hypothetical protein
MPDSSLVTPEEIRRLRQQQGGAGTVVTEEQVTPEDVRRMREAFASSLPGAAEHERTVATGRSSRESYLGAAVGQEQLAPGGADLSTRADIALSDTFEEKRKKFQAKYPQGDFRLIEVPSEVPGGGNYELVYRRSPTEPYGKFDPANPELGDIADMAGAIPEIVGETIAAYRSRGLTLPQQLRRLFFGAGIGELSQQATEEARGYQLEDPGQAYLSRPAQEGVTSMAGGLASTALTGPVNVARGAGSFRHLPGAQEAVRAGRQLGLPELLPTQTVDNPVLRLMGRQSQATAPNIGRVIREQHMASERVASGLFDKASLGQAGVNLEALEKNARQQVLNAARLVPTHTSVGGLAIQQGLGEWDKLAKAEVDGLYAQARAIQQPAFDITEAQKTAAKIKAGTQAELAQGGTTNVSGDLTPELAALADQIQALKPDAQGVEQLIELERRARDMAQPPMGQPMRKEHALAQELAGSIRTILDNPANPDPNFVAAWKKARSAAHQRFQTWDQIKATVSAVNREFQPAALAESLFQPGNYDTIRFVKNTLESRGLGSRWETLQDAYKTKLLHDPETALETVNRLDPETRKLLVSDVDLKDLQMMDEGLRAIRSTGVKAAMERQSQNALLVQDLVAREDSRGVANLLRMTGGANTPAGRSMRAGIIDMLVSKARKPMEGGGWMIDQQLLMSEMAKLDRVGAGKFLQANDRLALDNLVRYLRMVPSKADPGTSIQAAETVAGMRGLQIRAFHNLMEMSGVGRFVTSPTGRLLLSGAARPRITPMSARVFGGVLASVAQEMGQELEPAER